MEHDVIVIGAGIAGLAAAYSLSRKGRSVKVLESASHVGGRMSNVKVDGFTLDTGAQFLSSGYESLIALAVEVGLPKSSIATMSPYSAILRDGKPRRLRSTHPMDSWRSGLLSMRECLAWSGAAFPHSKWLLNAPLDDYSAWEALDDRSTVSWMRRAHGDALLSHAIEPTLQGLYFQAPEYTSRALTLLVAAYGARRCRTLAMRGGMGSLASALAARLDLETNCRVDRVQRVGRRVEIGSSKGTWKAAQVVSAVPSPIAAKFLMDQDTFEAEVLATAYGPGINVSWMLDGKYEPPESLIDVYGLLVPRSERRGVAAVAFETVKCPDRAPKDQLVNFMLDDVASTHALLQSDAVVNQLIRNATATVLPGIHERVSETRVFRWPMAMPLSPVGRARAVANYRRHVERMRPQVVLAGDYLGAPTTDSALSSGKWAARMLGGVGRESGPVSF